MMKGIWLLAIVLFSSSASAEELTLKISEYSDNAYPASSRIQIPSADLRSLDIYLRGAKAEIQLSSVRVGLNQMPMLTVVTTYPLPKGVRASLRLRESINPDMKLRVSGENLITFEATDDLRNRYTGQFYLTVGAGAAPAAVTAQPITIAETKTVVADTSGPPSDVDINIPLTKLKNPDAVAVVIGISRYKNSDVPPADYARRDASVMKQYLVNTLGFDERRIIELYDEQATLSAFKQVFEEQLPNWIRAGKSDVFVFYSGHGAPVPETKEAFFVPYDCNPTYAKSTGYRVQELYDRLAKLAARSVTTVIDACFSGSSEKGMLLKGVSPVFITVDNPIAGIPNGLVFTASSGQQVASWYSEKKHGLFTYYFLKGWRGEADGNKDRQVSAAEMEEYLLKNVPDQARYLNNREQTPQLMGLDKQRILVKY